MGDFSLTPPGGNLTLGQVKGEVTAQDLRARTSNADSKKIEKSARDFESILVGQWLEDAQKAFASVPGKDPNDTEDAGHDQFRSLAMQSLAGAISNKGGFGIASMIMRRLKESSGVPEVGAPEQAGGSPQVTQNNGLRKITDREDIH